MVSAAESRSENPWREIIYQRFRGLPAPLLCFPDGIIPAASIWTGSRVWLDALRASGLLPGDRVACALPPCPAFVQLLLAALWEGYTLALLPEGHVSEETLSSLDIRLLIADQPDAGLRRDHDNLPEHSARPALRPVKSSPTPHIQLLARGSGTSGVSKWVALSAANLLSVVRSHSPLLALEEARVLSVLPWHHLFGLVIELLPALFAGAEIIRAERGGRDPRELLTLGLEHQVTHLNAVPLTFLRLLEQPEGEALIRSLRGGVVGGAPISQYLATALHGTRLRVGYGQTEAAPGIALGEPGAFFEGCLGSALGCETRVTKEGMLEFRGPNLCLGLWGHAQLVAQDPEGWRCTGDLVEATTLGLRFVARADDCFKLANGRMVTPAAIESALRAKAPEHARFWVFTADNETLSLLYGSKGGTYAPSPTDLRAAFGGLFHLLLEVRALPSSEFHHTAKGELDRRAMRLALHGRGTLPLEGLSAPVPSLEKQLSRS